LHDITVKPVEKDHFSQPRRIFEKDRKNIELGKPPKKIYDEVNNEAGGVYCISK